MIHTRIKIIGLIVLVAGVGVLIFWMLKKPVQNKNNITINSSETSTLSIEELQKNIQLKRQAEAAFKSVQAVDADLDGISDVDEVQKYHTDPNKADTDGDGILDKDEIELYHTDPTKADTDNDGFTDGDELRNGYNPLGPGKLATSTKS